MPIIEVNHVTKEFQLGQLHSLKQTALNGLRRLAGQPVEERQPFKALDDVSFSVEEGEVLGIIGHNGARFLPQMQGGHLAALGPHFNYFKVQPL